MNVGILKATDNLDNGVDFSNVSEKFISESFSSRGSFNKPGDINKFNCGWDDDLSFSNVLQHIEPRIWHSDNSYIGINGAKRVVGCLRFSSAGDRIEQGRFS